MKLPVMERPASAPEEFEDHAKLMMDLLVIAFQTDMTRVITFMLAREGSNRSYREIGVSDGHHSCHASPERSGKDREDASRSTRTTCSSFAYLVDKLKSTPDGDGTLLDHSMILYGSSICDGNAHTHLDLPLVLVGGGAGQIKGGRHIRYPKETPMNNLLVSMLDKAGVPTEKLGDSTGKLEHLSDV